MPLKFYRNKIDSQPITEAEYQALSWQDKQHYEPLICWQQGPPLVHTANSNMPSAAQGITNQNFKA